MERRGNCSANSENLDCDASRRVGDGHHDAGASRRTLAGRAPPHGRHVCAFAENDEDLDDSDDCRWDFSDDASSVKNSSASA